MTASRSPLAARIGHLVRQTVAGLDGHPDQAAVSALGGRLDEPLRVAIAGKVKAGKSTLLNALVGERLAPTDAGECTTIVTWYQDGSTYRVMMHAPSEEPRQLPFRRDDHALLVDLQGRDPGSIERLAVEWPSSALRELTLIDTPGVDSINTEISARTEMLLNQDEGPRAADAVIYLMRHLHESDVRFLESFHDQVAAQPSAINAVGVLSRADEIGVGRLDALGSARRIAARYSADPKIRRLVQVVLPVAGLLAETAATLRQEEFRLLELLAHAERGVLDSLVLSVDRFAHAETDLAITPLERQELLDRFGIFGVRLSTALIRQQRANTSAELASLLTERSGFSAIRSALHSNFSSRADVLRCRTVLLAIERVVQSTPRTSRLAAVETELEQIIASVHEFTEVKLLAALRAGAAELPGNDVERAERLLGSDGAMSHERLGTTPDVEPTELHAAAVEQLRYWQALSENPLVSQIGRESARVLIRSCEGLISAAHSAMTSA